MLEQFTTWLLALLKQLFKDLWQFVIDLLLTVFEQIVNAFVYVVSHLPVPGFLTAGLGSVFGQLDGSVMYLVTQCGLPAALAVIGSGYAFRIVRKFATLFQW
ncbi:hypothetical protein ACTJKJ_20260 [Roseateles sp. 22389]|uniref:hypothetical protein n=1 Tax=Roseateles sp. 22389 TaxID=3453916 RepID=UPI003F84F67D